AIVTEISDQFLLLAVDRDHRLLFRQSCGHLGVDMGELRIPVGVTVALLGLAVGLQAVARRIEQFGHQGAAHLVALRLQRLRQPPHALAGPPQRRFRIPACRWFDQRLEIREQGRVLENRRLAPRPRPPNPLRRLILRQFPQTAPDRARRHAGCRRHRGNATISRSKRLGRRDQTTTPLIKKRRHRGKPLSDGFNFDHHHKIWYDDWVVNPCFTLSKVDSLISGRALRLLLRERFGGGPGQYDGDDEKLYLPLARGESRIVLTFADNKIAAVEPGEAFDLAEWERISREIES